MPYLLNLLYLLLLTLVWPLLAFRAARSGKYREGYAAKFWGRVPRRTSDAPCLWLHAVSVGEVNLLAPLLGELRRRHPHWQCVISSTTKTGLELARRKYPDLTVFYCPLDFSWAVREAMGRIRPDVLMLAELELWPNLLAAARQRGARVVVINGRLSDRSYRGYLRIRPLVRWMLAKVDLIGAQTTEYAGRFIALGAAPDRVHVTGSLKFDGALADRQSPAVRRLAQLAGFRPDDVVLLAGSTQDPEEIMVLDIFRRLEARYPQLRLVIVPRHAERFETVAEMLTTAGVLWQRRSALDSAPPAPGARVLLVDRIGELSAWWGTARVGFVGGSIGTRGGQNMIEPAAYGVATCFGPNTQNFREIVAQLLTADAAVVVTCSDEICDFLRLCLNERDYAKHLGERARQLVASQIGATRRTVDLLEGLLGNPAVRQERSTAAA